METNKKLIRECLIFEPNSDLLNESLNNPNKPFRVRGIVQRKNSKNQNGRIYPSGVLERSVEKYINTFVREHRALGECVPRGTEVFTKHGWQNIEDVVVGEEIFTLNVSNNILELQSVTDKIEKNYNDQMIHIYNSSNLDMMITKHHKVVLWDRYDEPYILTGEELHDKIKNNDSKVSHSYIRNSGNWIGTSPEYFDLPNSDIKINIEDWAAFLGIYLAEGHCAGTRGGELRKTVGITQVKEDTKQKIKELLDKLPFKYTSVQNRQFLINEQILHDHLFELGNSHTKKIPEYAKEWSPRLLNILLDWMLLGDGKNRKNKNGILLREYCTTSPQLAEDTFEIMLKLGSGATTSIRIQGDSIIQGRVILAENCKPLYIVHEKTTKGIYLDCRFLYSELVDFNDNVYCVTVPNSTWLMKYNEKISWTHNCDHPDSEIVNLKNSSHNIIDLTWNGDDLIGTLEILTTPSGNIVKELFKCGIRVGISSRATGSVKKISESTVMVNDDLELVAFDVVSNPSTEGAFLHPTDQISLAEGIIKNPLTNKWTRTDELIHNILTELN